MELFTFTPYASSGEGFNLSATYKDGQAWFIAADVCRSLEIKNASQAVVRLDADDRGVISTYTLGGVQEVLAVSEPGLYRLIFTSRKKSAQVFQKWVFTHVLPSIRKHGGYINEQEALSQEAQAEIIQQVHVLAQRTQEQAREERDDRRAAFKIMNSYGSRKRVRRPPTS